MTNAENLWNEFIDGNELSFEKLMKLYSRTLLNYGSKFTQDKELIKDTLQELFIYLWNRKEKLSAAVNPKMYLTASFRRMLHRKIQSEKPFLKETKSEEYFSYFHFELSVEENIISNESTSIQAKNIAQKIELLPKRQKEVIYLKFFYGLNRNEIAEVMEISEQTVSNLLQLAFKFLRAYSFYHC